MDDEPVPDDVIKALRTLAPLTWGCIEFLALSRARRDYQAYRWLVGDEGAWSKPSADQEARLKRAQQAIRDKTK